MVDRDSSIHYRSSLNYLFQIVIIFFLCSCSSFRTAPTRKDVKNLKSATTIESKQEQIVTHSQAIEVLAEETKDASIKIQNRSDGSFHFPKWLWWTLIIGGLAYLGLLPVVAGIGIKVVHNIAKGIKQVDY